MFGYDFIKVQISDEQLTWVVSLLDKCTDDMSATGPTPEQVWDYDFPVTHDGFIAKYDSFTRFIDFYKYFEDAKQTGFGRLLFDSCTEWADQDGNMRQYLSYFDIKEGETPDIDIYRLPWNLREILAEGLKTCTLEFLATYEKFDFSQNFFIYEVENMDEEDAIDWYSGYLHSPAGQQFLTECFGQSVSLFQ